MSPVRRAAAVGVVVVATLLGLASPALAHPLGNSSTNLSSELRVGADRIVVDHLVDLAEIRTLQLLPAVDLDRDDEVSEAESDAYAEGACAALPADLSLTAGGAQLELVPQSWSFALVPGQGGLSTSRLSCQLGADHELSGPTEIAYRDDSYAGRFGWREVTAVYDRTTAERTDVSADSTSDRLTAYPADGASGPLPDIRGASLLVRPGGPALVADDTRDPLGRGPGALPGVDRLTTAFTDLVGRTDLTLGVALLSLLVALVLGAGHALAPGHGKTVMAAYLVGQEGTRRQAFQLGGIVTLTHTLGVLLLGVLLLASTTLASERVVAGLEVASGVLLAVVGGYLLRRALLRRRAARSSLAGHDHAGHDHAGHDHAGHDHAGHDHAGHDHAGHDHAGHDHAGHDHAGHDHAGHDQPGHDHAGHDRAGHRHAGHDHEGHDHEGHDHAGHDHAGGHDEAGPDHDAAPHHHGPDPRKHGREHPAPPQPVAAGAVLVQTAPPVLADEPRRTVVVDHDHGFGQHTHVLPDPARPLGARSLAAMGVAGGLVPSPSALVVLLGANAIGRTWWGVVLVVAYGIGMALTLTLAGLALLRVRNLVAAAPDGSRRSRLTLPVGLMTLLPVLTAGVIILVGAGLVLRGLLLSSSFG